MVILISVNMKSIKEIYYWNLFKKILQPKISYYKSIKFIIYVIFFYVTYKNITHQGTKYNRSIS